MTKQEVLQNALNLNGEDKKYSVRVENDSIITEVKWMNAVFFSPKEVTDEVKTFKFIAKLNDDNTWTELDESKSVTKSASWNGFSGGYSSFKGTQTTYSKTISFGKDRNTGKTGIVNVTFNSNDYKKPVIEYLESCGYKKAKKGFWKTLLGK